MIKAQNNTNPKWSFGKAKRIFSSMEDEEKLNELNRLNGSYYYGNKSFDTNSKENKKMQLFNNKNNVKDTDYYYTNIPLHIYKYNRVQGGTFGKSPRKDLNEKEKYCYYNLPYIPGSDIEKIKKKWNSHIIGGDIGADSRWKLSDKEIYSTPGPGRYNKVDPYQYKLKNTNNYGYMGYRVGRSPILRYTGCKDNIGPGSYELGNEGNDIKFNKSPKISIGKEKRKFIKPDETNNGFGFNPYGVKINESYYDYSSFGHQIMTQKDTRPGFTIGKEERFRKIIK